MPKKGIAIRIILSSLFFILIFLIVIYKFYELQIKRHTELYEKARSKYTQTIKQKAERGKIFDVKGKLLATNQPCFEISIDPSFKTFEKESDCREIAEFLAKKTENNAEEIFQKLTNKKLPDGRIRKYAKIADFVDLDTASEMKDYIKEKKWKGIFFIEKTKRYYPYNQLLINIIGFVNIDKGQEIAQSGIEKTKEKSITPEEGKIIIERDRTGYTIEEHILEQCRPGNDIYLTISQEIQMIVEEELDKIVQMYNPLSAYIVMANPWNGNIMAIGQRPTFNPNDRSSIKSFEAMKDKVISEAFEPGSIMKPIPVSGAIDFGIINPDDTFDCENGAWFYAGKILRDAHPYSILTVREIIQKSSNIGTAKIAIKLGAKRLDNIFKRFEFGQKTGIPIQTEAKGIYRPLDKWDPLSISRFPIGQGILVSPLQIVRAYCAIANGGNLVKLRLVDREVNPTTNESFIFPVEREKKIFLRPDTAKKITDMLKLVTKKGGTAERAAIKGYEVAGKTGTSQKFIDGAYSNTKFHSSFIGFVPADKPAFVMLIMVDEPNGNHYGGIVAAPSFRNIGEKVLRILDIPPMYIDEYEENYIKKKNGEDTQTIP
ncbi:MAG TPA: penicillin-binding protein 2 [Victivallales bacterium]|nr:penicillin-binding protein 2 [Victivallales bacterium]HRU01775.1 penicillin-binding protein 2 [Victivallales bacterium]